MNTLESYQDTDLRTRSVVVPLRDGDGASVSFDRRVRPPATASVSPAAERVSSATMFLFVDGG
jgi:hypothetical protein